MKPEELVALVVAAFKNKKDRNNRWYDEHLRFLPKGRSGKPTVKVREGSVTFPLLENGAGPGHADEITANGAFDIITDAVAPLGLTAEKVDGKPFPGLPAYYCVRVKLEDGES